MNLFIFTIISNCTATRAKNGLNTFHLVTLKGFKLCRIRVELQKNLRFPDDFNRNRLQHIQNGLVGKMSLTGGSQAAIKVTLKEVAPGFFSLKIWAAFVAPWYGCSMDHDPSGIFANTFHKT